MNTLVFSKIKLMYFFVLSIVVSLSSCNKEYTNDCPIIVIDQWFDESKNQFAFVVTMEEPDSEIALEWFLDSVPVTIEDGVNGSLKERTFFPQGLQLGEHFVEVKYRSFNCPIASDISRFEVLYTVNNQKCNNMFFTSRRKNNSVSSYVFNTSFQGRDEIAYDWFIDDVLVESELVGDDKTDHKLIYNFSEEIKDYKVCVVSKEFVCREQAFFCRTISVRPYALCPDFEKFEYELLDAATKKYKISAFFNDDITSDYFWGINGSVVPQSDEVTVSSREFYTIINLRSGYNDINFFPRSEGCSPEVRFLENKVL